jgi:hypothetical protein
MTVTIFYANQSMLDSLNTGTLTPNTLPEAADLLTAVRGNIKSVQFGFDDIQISSSYFDGNTNGINAENSFIELMDGTKYYFNVFRNDGFQTNGSATGFEFNAVTMEFQDGPIGSYNYIQWNGIQGIVSSSLQIDALAVDGYYEAEGAFSPNGWFELSSTPVEWSGGGNPPSGPAMYNGKYIMTAETDPTQVELLVGGQPLPTGSVVKVGSQKFFKLNGNSTAFSVIPQTPPVEWGWDSSADSDWAVLQGF